jgi:hypothetical protein
MPHLREKRDLFNRLGEFVLWDFGLALEDSEGLRNPLETEKVVSTRALVPDSQFPERYLFAATSILRTGRSATPFTITGFSVVSCQKPMHFSQGMYVLV